MRIFFREMILSIILSLIFMFIFAIILSQTKLNENLINPVTIGIVAFSLMVGAFRISKAKKEKGILYGALLGLIYMIILYLISSAYNFQFALSMHSIIMIILGIIGGAIGGIIGVNL